ncbi:MAG TPA: hypothetical protein VN577_04980 [Terriglobales bacterium]|nr:hypothetical protein [Terriglobales bacterium]
MMLTDVLPVQRNRENAAGLGKYLETMRWQFFTTLTFPYEVSQNGATAKLAMFIDNLERSLGGSVAYAGGLDTRDYSGSGMTAVRPHFHLIMSLETKVDPSFIRKAWTGYVGNGQNRSALGGPVQDSADVRPFEYGRGGAAYCVKVVDDEGDWIQRNLELVSPQTCAGERIGRRVRRSLRRCADHRRNRA